MRYNLNFRKAGFFPAALFVLIFFFFLSGVSAQNRTDEISIEKAKHLEQRLDSFFGKRNPDNPGGVLIITQAGQTIYSKVFGKSNLEIGTDITYETLFEAASVSKQFTAAAILVLQQEGKLNIEDDVHKFIPGLPDYGYTITIRHLLTHTSGLKDWRNITYLQSLFTANRLFTQDMALDLITRQQSLNFAPGTQYRYSNSGYDLLGTIVERVTGRPFRDFVLEKLLKPAGMNHSFFRNNYTDIVPERALGYLTRDGKYIQGVVLDETNGAAGLYTTAGDLQKWNEYIFSDKISKEFFQIRHARFKLNDGTVIPYANGGVEVHDYNSVVEIRHGGLISGYRAWLAYYPGSRISVSYMSNDRNILTTDLSLTIKKALFGEESGEKNNGIKISSAIMDKVSGIYQNTNDKSAYLDLKYRDGQLYSSQKQIVFLSGKEFKLDNDLYRIAKNGLSLITKEGKSFFKKVVRIEMPADDYSLFQGRYVSEDCGVVFNVVFEKNKLYAERTSFDRIELTPIYENSDTITFRSLSNGIRTLFHFTKNQTGGSVLNVSLPRADLIPFIKQ